MASETVMYCSAATKAMMFHEQTTARNQTTLFVGLKTKGKSCGRE